MFLTEQQEKQLEVIRNKAKKDHEKSRRAAKRQGRHSFPDLPFECSCGHTKKNS